MSIQLILGDCLERMKDLPDDSVDSVVTDPPYGLSFMGKCWDHGVPGPHFWEQALRVLKPGGHLLAFGGSRTYHWLAMNVEISGFEIRDQIMWVYGSGFPKSRNLEGSWKGWGTALKPSHEPIVMARKPFKGTVSENVLEHGTGAINIDGCRVDGRERTDYGLKNSKRSRGVAYGMPTESANFDGSKGRWPANFIHDGSDEVLAGFPQSSVTGKRTDRSKSATVGRTVWGVDNHKSTEYTDSGSTARFYYCAKTSRRDRHEGVGDPGPQLKHGSTLREVENTHTKGNNHPTVKPTDLMRYLCRLVTPPRGVILDPFMGSGSTGKAAMIEGFGFIGIELEPEYFSIAEQRINAATKEDAA